MRKFDVLHNTIINGIMLNTHVVEVLMNKNIYTIVLYNLTHALNDPTKRFWPENQTNRITFLKNIYKCDCAKTLVLLYFDWSRSPEGESYWSQKINEL